MDTDSVDKETIVLPNIDELDEKVKSNVLFRNCGDIKKNAGLPQTRECDDLSGKSMSLCIGSTGQDCTQTFKTWSQLIFGSFYGILKSNLVMVEFKPANVFFDGTKLTIVGIDYRDGKDTSKQKTIEDISKVIAELLMKKNITTTDLIPFKKVPSWSELKLEKVVDLYHLVNNS